MQRQTKRLVRGAVFILLVVPATASLPAWAQYAGGTGTADDPYLIETAEQLNSIGLYPEDWNKHFRLTADIDMNDLGGARVNLIGAYGAPFEGVFDGNDHTIANLVYHVKDEDGSPTSNYVFRIGLFRIISGWDALVQDLGLIEPDVQPGPGCSKWVDYVGALAGSLGDGWIRNCYVQGGRVGGRSDVGGLVGGCFGNAAVSECWSTAQASGSGAVGGLVGYGAGVSIWSCHAGGRASGTFNIGGLVGFLLETSTIEDCFTTGTVTGYQAGGLVGWVEEASVSRCYSTASVSGDAGSWSLGGLAGVNHGVIRSSWAGGEVAGGLAIGGLVGYNHVGDGIWLPYFDAKVTDSYATGPVRGNGVGGLIGSNEGTLLRCYATGVVTTSGPTPASDPKSSAGGLVGTDKSVSKWDILGCFWDTTTSGVSKSAGGTGLTTTEMQDLTLYLAAGWDFAGETANGTEDLWKMIGDEPAYPRLAWEEIPATDPADPNDAG